MGLEEGRLAEGSLGFGTGSPSLDMHLWAVRCGYAAGPKMVRWDQGFVSLLSWLSPLDIGVVVPVFLVCNILGSAEDAF